ncbi:hypothetical protein IW262DRAFT_1298321 [Armillaria fumosa]|nr:hypothetical protein IW262DRAFT_1298321 [Armillaria fumosa]
MNALHERSSLEEVVDFVEYRLREESERTGHYRTLSFPSFSTPAHIPVILRHPRYSVYKNLHLWSNVLRPFLRLAFCDINEFTPLRPERSSVPTSWAWNIIALNIWNVSIPRDTLSEIISSCLKLDILILGRLCLTASEAPARISAQAAIRVHELKELSLINFPDAHMADFLKLIRKSPRVKISVHSLRKLIIAMDPTLNPVLSADLKYELTVLLRDNLFRRSGDAPSMLKELRVICEAFDGYISGNVLLQISLPSVIRHSRLSKVTLDLWEKPTMPIQLLSRIVDGLPTHTSLDIIFATCGNVPKKLEALDSEFMERYEKGRPSDGERPPTTFLVIEIPPSDSNEVAKHRARKNFKKHVLPQSIRKGYLVIRDSI